jgi:hypothetical protein
VCEKEYEQKETLRKHSSYKSCNRETKESWKNNYGEGKHPLFKYSKLKFHPNVTKQSKHRRIFGYTFHLLNSQAIKP